MLMQYWFFLQRDFSPFWLIFCLGNWDSCLLWGLNAMFKRKIKRKEVRIDWKKERKLLFLVLCNGVCAVEFVFLLLSLPRIFFLFNFRIPLQSSQKIAFIGTPQKNPNAPAEIKWLCRIFKIWFSDN